MKKKNEVKVSQSISQHLSVSITVSINSLTFSAKMSHLNPFQMIGILANIDLPLEHTNIKIKYLQFCWCPLLIEQIWKIIQSSMGSDNGLVNFSQFYFWQAQSQLQIRWTVLALMSLFTSSVRPTRPNQKSIQISLYIKTCFLKFIILVQLNLCGRLPHFLHKMKENLIFFLMEANLHISLEQNCIYFSNGRWPPLVSKCKTTSIFWQKTSSIFF